MTQAEIEVRAGERTREFILRLLRDLRIERDYLAGLGLDREARREQVKMDLWRAELDTLPAGGGGAGRARR